MVVYAHHKHSIIVRSVYQKEFSPNVIYWLQEAYENDRLLGQQNMTLEFASYSDGKEAVAKAANLLLAKYLQSANSGGDSEERIFNEPHMTEALRAVGLFYFSDVLSCLGDLFYFSFNLLTFNSWTIR